MTLSDRKWKLFAIEELFVVSGTTTTSPGSLIIGGTTPRITCQAVNNGLEGIYANPPTEKGGVITIDSATDGAVNYQEFDFIATDHVEKLTLKDDKAMDRYVGIFVVSAIRNSIGEKYGYGYNFSQTRIKRQTISLPAKDNGRPDWDFMTDYMKQQERAILDKYKAYLAVIERERERE